jgi:poly-beta-1,6-N-acetyl-D-glucosamine synthase
MLFYLPFLLLFYIIFTGVLFFFWLKISLYKRKENVRPTTRLSVLIAVRNEAGKIEALLQDLEKQSYPKEIFEVLIMNDHSSDNTAELVQSFKKMSGLKLRLISMPEGITGKKNAIAEGVRNAEGALIVTTDGDCRVGTRWLETLACYYEEKKVKMITAGVVFFKGNTIREKIMELEFSSLVGSGASTLSMGYPTMCNGANLAYEKKAFLEVNGYEGSEALASGDDEFLMHKIYKKYPGKIIFLKNKDAIVETEAPLSWKVFFEQRKRWASKWESYTYTHVQLIALLVFGSNLALVLNFFLCPLESYPLGIFLIFLIVKFMLEFLFLRSVLVYFGRKVNIWIFLITEITYPFYVVLFALLSRNGKYKWKDREISKK